MNAVVINRSHGRVDKFRVARRKSEIQQMLGNLVKEAIYNERRTVRFPKCTYWIKFQYLWGGSFHAKRIPEIYIPLFPVFFEIIDLHSIFPRIV